MKDVENMADFLMEHLAALGVTAEKRHIGKHQLGGKEVDLPPVVIGQIGKDPKKVSFSLPTIPTLRLSCHDTVDTWVLELVRRGRGQRGWKSD